jgi:hypothetical protein
MLKTILKTLMAILKWTAIVGGLFFATAIVMTVAMERSSKPTPPSSAVLPKATPTKVVQPAYSAAHVEQQASAPYVNRLLSTDRCIVTSDGSIDGVSFGAVNDASIETMIRQAAGRIAAHAPEGNAFKKFTIGDSLSIQDLDDATECRRSENGLLASVTYPKGTAAGVPYEELVITAVDGVIGRISLNKLHYRIGCPVSGTCEAMEQRIETLLAALNAHVRGQQTVSKRDISFDDALSEPLMQDRIAKECKSHGDPNGGAVQKELYNDCTNRVTSAMMFQVAMAGAPTSTEARDYVVTTPSGVRGTFLFQRYGMLDRDRLTIIAPELLPLLHRDVASRIQNNAVAAASTAAKNQQSDF